MKLTTIVADNAEIALAQIQRELGPDAMVVSVRKLASNGFSRLWRHGGKIEVTAGVPEPDQPKRHSIPAQSNDYIRPTAIKWMRIFRQNLVGGGAVLLGWNPWVYYRHWPISFRKGSSPVMEINPPPQPIAEWDARQKLASAVLAARPPENGRHWSSSRFYRSAGFR